MATVAVFHPFHCETQSTNFPETRYVNRRAVLAFDPTTDETAYFPFIAPQGLTTPLTVVVTWMMASATSGTCGWQACVEAVSSGDATDLDATTSFGAQSSASASVPGTAGSLLQTTIALTDDDAIAAGDYGRLAVNRDANSTVASDTAAGDAYVLMIELRDAA